MAKTASIPKPDAAAPIEEHLDYWQSKKYHVIEQTDSSAQLVKSRVGGIDWRIIEIVVLVIGVVIYLLFFMGKKADLIDLSVVEGEVQTNQSRAKPPRKPASDKP